MSITLSHRVKAVKPSPTLAITARAAAMRAAGKDIIGRGAGEPDFDTPDNIKQAAIRAIQGGKASKYTAVEGLAELKAAIVKKFKRENNLDYALDEIMVSNGSKQIMFGATMASVNPGDEVIVPSPGWISYADQIKLCGGVPVHVSCPENNHFKLRAEDLEAAITPRTKWVVLNFPNNPTGAVCTRDELKQLTEVLPTWQLSR